VGRSRIGGHSARARALCLERRGRPARRVAVFPRPPDRAARPSSSLAPTRRPPLQAARAAPATRVAAATDPLEIPAPRLECRTRPRNDDDDHARRSSLVGRAGSAICAFNSSRGASARSSASDDAGAGAGAPKAPATPPAAESARASFSAPPPAPAKPIASSPPPAPAKPIASAPPPAAAKAGACGFTYEQLCAMTRVRGAWADAVDDAIAGGCVPHPAPRPRGGDSAARGPRPGGECGAPRRGRACARLNGARW
jgi:hypothetical protein